MSRIFVSYRQDDAKAWAVLLRSELCHSFDEREVFLDKDTLDAGTWQAQIQAALQRASVVLVVIGRHWLSIADSSGRRRLDHPKDVHRNEVAYALSQPGITVIPVRVDGSAMPTEAELPPDLRPLAALQSFEVSDNADRRAGDLRRLISNIERLSGLSANRGVQRGRPTTPWRGVRSTGLALLSGLMASLCLAVASDMLLGWTFSANETLLLAAMLAGAGLGLHRMRRRRNGRSGHAEN